MEAPYERGRLLESIARRHATKLIRIKGSRAHSLFARFCRQDEKGVRVSAGKKQK